MEVTYFTILYWFCHTSTWIRHRYTRVPHPESPSLLLPCTIPLGHLSAPAPSIQYHASNLDWQFISYMILYMFQCHPPKLSHPFPLPESKSLLRIHLNSFGWNWSLFPFKDTLWNSKKISLYTSTANHCKRCYEIYPFIVVALSLVFVKLKAEIR